MKHLVTTMTLAALISGSALATDRKEDVQAFKDLYKEYKESYSSGDFDIIAEAAGAAWEAARKVYPADNQNMIEMTFVYAKALRRADKEPAARKIANTHVKDMLALPDKGGEKTIEVLFRHVDLYNWVKNSGGKTALRRALKQSREIWGEGSLEMGMAYLKAGMYTIDKLGYRGAPTYLNKAEKIFTEFDARERLAITQLYLGKYNLGTRKNRSAVKYLNRSLETLGENATTSHIALTNHAFLVQAYEKIGESEEATKHCQAIGKAHSDIENRDMQPVYILAATYPVEMQRRNKNGWAVVQFTVDEQGFVRNPEVVETQGGKAFGQAAIEAAEKYRYAPRYVEGKPVATHDVRYRVKFQIAN